MPERNSRKVDPVTAILQESERTTRKALNSSRSARDAIKAAR